MLHLINRWFPKESEESGSESEGSENLFLAFEKTGPKLLIKKNGDACIRGKSLIERDFKSKGREQAKHLDTLLLCHHTQRRAWPVKYMGDQTLASLVQH